MAHTEIRVTIDRPLAEVFATYTRPDAFRWANLRSVRWTCGNPWEIGSRLRIEPDDPYGTIVDQVLTHFESERFVSFISHFVGVTLQSEVHFRALPNNQTEIDTQLEFIGSFSRIASFPLKSAIEQAIQRVYEDLKRECEQPIARKQRRSTRVPLRVEIEAQGIGDSVKCKGETVVVNCHGALISTVATLQVRMRIEVGVMLTKRRALVDVVHVDPEQPGLYGIELLRPQNIWGLPLPPHDWLTGDSKAASE